MRDHIIETASRLFYANGIRAVGMDRVIAEADIAKATLYRHFPTKEQLIVAYLRTRSLHVLSSMKSAIRSAGDSPTKRVTGLFRLLERDAHSAEFRGCAFMLAVAEHEESEAIRDVARAHKDAVKRVFLHAVSGSGKAGAKRLAEQLALLHDGALASILVYRNPQAAKTAAFIAGELLALMPA
jgi:AcrR family transcriptional regulator